MGWFSRSRSVRWTSREVGSVPTVEVEGECTNYRCSRYGQVVSATTRGRLPGTRVFATITCPGCGGDVKAFGVC